MSCFSFVLVLLMKVLLFVSLPCLVLPAVQLNILFYCNYLFIYSALVVVV